MITLDHSERLFGVFLFIYFIFILNTVSISGFGLSRVLHCSVCLSRVFFTTLKSSNHIICLPSKFKAKCVQKAALQECVRAPALLVCTSVTLTHVVTVATGVRSALQNLDIITGGSCITITGTW